MALFGSFKKAFTAGAREVKAEYAQNKDFLEAVCAVVALVSYADGDLEEDERKKAFKIIGNHATLSKLYKQDEVERTLEAMFKRADSHSGRAQLLRELDDVKGKGATMGEDCYLVGLDIAHADGQLEEAEAKVLQTIATRMDVDLKKLGLTD